MILMCRFKTTACVFAYTKARCTVHIKVTNLKCTFYLCLHPCCHHPEYSTESFSNSNKDRASYLSWREGKEKTKENVWGHRIKPQNSISWQFYLSDYKFFLICVVLIFTSSHMRSSVPHAYHIYIYTHTRAHTHIYLHTHTELNSCTTHPLPSIPKKKRQE